MAGEKLIVASVLCGLLILQSTSGYLIFTIEPQPLTAFYTKELTFQCAATNATLYQWLLDGTQNYLSDSDIDATTYTVVETSVKVSTLAIHPPQDANKLNYTFVQCIAINHNTEFSIAEYNKSKEALLQVQGKLDAPKINELLVDCSSRSFNISWDDPETLEGIFVTGYEVCRGHNCTSIRNTTLSWAESFSIVEAFTCEVDITRVAALIEEERGYYAEVNNTFTQGPEFIKEHQIESEVVFLADKQTFQIVFMINLNETDACHLPDGYRVRVSYAKSSQPENDFFTHVELVSEDDNFQQMFSVNVSGQNTEAFSILEPENCIGSNTSMKVKNRLFHLQSVDLNNEYITCTFAEGSNAMGCETVLTCNTSVSGKVETSKVASLIKLDPSLSYATGSIVSVEFSDCLTYDVSVYEVLSNGSMGAYAAKVFNNITFEPGSLPTLNYDKMPTSSRSSSSLAPTEDSKDTKTLVTAVSLTATVIFVFSIGVTMTIILVILRPCRKVCKPYNRRKPSRVIPTDQQQIMDSITLRNTYI